MLGMQASGQVAWHLIWQVFVVCLDTRCLFYLNPQLTSKYSSTSTPSHSLCHLNLSFLSLTNVKCQTGVWGSESQSRTIGNIENIARTGNNLLTSGIRNMEFTLKNDLHFVELVGVGERLAVFQPEEASCHGRGGIVGLRGENVPKEDIVARKKRNVEFRLGLRENLEAGYICEKTEGIVGFDC